VKNQKGFLTVVACARLTAAIELFGSAFNLCLNVISDCET
jgi:hypothetical protein